MTEPLPTSFMPAEKADPAEIEKQRAQFSADSALAQALQGRNSAWNCRKRPES